MFIIMGQKDLSSILKGITNIKINSFEFLKKIGEGGFGKVWKVRYIKENKIVALKELSKKKILEKKMIDYIFKERDILLSLYSNSISNLYYTFQDKNNLYMILDYLPGGDLRNLMKKYDFFSEEEIKFITGCVIFGLEYLHLNNIIHRDIKPENLIIDEKGYIRISDFGISTYINNPNLNNDISGTFGYIAPERYDNYKKISFESDYFSLGVIIYELIKGERPFKKDKKYEMIEEFENNNIHLCKNNVNSRYSEDLCDFVNKLLEIDPNMRLGKNGIHEIKNHNFFNNFDWKSIYYYKSKKSPFYIERKNGKIKEKNKTEKNTSYQITNEDCKIDEKYQKNFENFTKVHLINENDFALSYLKKLQYIPSSINGDLFNSVKKKPSTAKNKRLSSLKKNNDEKQIINNNHDSRNYEKILNSVNDNEKTNYVFSNYQPKKNYKNRIKFKLTSQNSNILTNKTNSTFENQTKNYLKKIKYHSTNNSLLNDDNIFLKMEKSKINKDNKEIKYFRNLYHQ